MKEYQQAMLEIWNSNKISQYNQMKNLNIKQKQI